MTNLKPLEWLCASGDHSYPISLSLCGRLRGLITAATSGRLFSTSSVLAVWLSYNICFLSVVRADTVFSTNCVRVIPLSGLPPSRVPTFLVELGIPIIYGPTTSAISVLGRVLTLFPLISCIHTRVVPPFVFGWG